MSGTRYQDAIELLLSDLTAGVRARREALIAAPTWQYIHTLPGRDVLTADEYKPKCWSDEDEDRLADLASALGETVEAAKSMGRW